MPSLLEMLGGVLVLRVVAAADVSALPHRRRCTQVSPMARHSSQPSVLARPSLRIQMSASGRHRGTLRSSVKMHGECYHQEAAGLHGVKPAHTRGYNSRGCMTKGRLEAFTDGVIAVIITIMVLELKVPHDPIRKRSCRSFRCSSATC